jgi:membrane protease YdiL (CAAX protease family)
MSNPRSQIERHALPTFFAATLGLGWLLTIAAAALSSNPLLLPLFAIPISFVPAVMAWLVLHLAGTIPERLAWRRRLTRVRVGWRWYAIALLALPLAYLAGLGIATAGGGDFPLHLQTLSLLPIFLLTNYGEEIGWRGYALPKLQDRMSPLTASLLLGVIWGAFHWVALAGNADAPLAYMAVSTIQLVAVSVIMTFVFNGSRESVPVVALMHAMYDTVAIGMAPLVETGVPLLAFSMTAVVTWVIAIGLVALTGGRLGRPTIRQPEPLQAA